MGSGASQIPGPVEAPDDHFSKLLAQDAPHWRSSVEQGPPLAFAERGIASKEGSPPTTLPEIFRAIVQSKGLGKVSALRVERPVPPLVDGKAPPPLAPVQLTTWNFEQYYEETRAVAASMITLGFQPHDCVCILGSNSPEWFFAGIGSTFAGGCFTGIYNSDTPQQCNWKAKLSKSVLIFVDSDEAGDKFIETIEDLPDIKAIIHWNPDFAKGKPPHKRQDGSEVKLLSYDEFKDLGKGKEAEVSARIDKGRAESCAELIFTSGTTGNPKAVMMSHDNLIFEARSMIEQLRSFADINQPLRSLSYLPLSHIAGSLSDIVIPLVQTHDIIGPHGYEITFARPYDLKAGSLADRLKLTRPSIFFGVPRVWEKIQEKLIKIGKSSKGVKKHLMATAKAKGLEYAVEHQVGHSGRKPFGYDTAKKVVLHKVAQALGLDDCIIGFTGAAPIRKETQAFFGALGINICEVYGMSECAGASVATTPICYLWGSCGSRLPGVDVRVFTVDPNDFNKKTECPRADSLDSVKPENEGEICFRGRSVMMGYLANPALGPEHVAEIEKKNKETIDEEGWLHSGDKGCMDKNGMLKITGRFKELIIGAGGENIAPVPIEDAIKVRFPGISNLVMIGDKRKFNVALVTLKAEGATGELPGTDMLDSNVLDVSPGITTVSGACKDETWIKRITDAIKSVNTDGSIVPSNAARIQKFTILPCDFSVLNEELTATLKLKRSVVEAKHSEAIEAMYNSDKTYVPYPV